MIRALHTAATGLEAQQMNMDVIANNLANANTSGYKKVRAEFRDLYYQTIRAPGAPTSDGTATANQVQVGLGVETGGTQRMFSQGTLAQSSNPLDLSIDGEGFFQVLDFDGRVRYTRDGTFQLDAEGAIVNSRGFRLEPRLNVPEGATEVQISVDGKVSAVLNGADAATELGTIETVRFANPAGLEAIGDNLYLATSGSGDPISGAPGLEGRGTLRQGFLEGSNVQVVEEMVRMIVAQRAFEVNSKVIAAADEMLRLVNNLRV